MVNGEALTYQMRKSHQLELVFGKSSEIVVGELNRRINTNIMLMVSLLVLVVTTSAQIPSRVEAGKKLASANCGRTELKQGTTLDTRRKLRLGKPAKFDDGVGISAGFCYPLFSGDRLVTWLDLIHGFGERIFVRRCVEDATIQGVAAGARGGSVEEEFDELFFEASGEFTFQRLSLPHWSAFANASFCKSSVAYWGTEFSDNSPAKVSAIVFDLSAGREVKREFVGTTEIESDSRDFFPGPIWQLSGTRVDFKASRAKKSVRRAIRKATIFVH